MVVIIDVVHHIGAVYNVGCHVTTIGRTKCHYFHNNNNNNNNNNTIAGFVVVTAESELWILGSGCRIDATTILATDIGGNSDPDSKVVLRPSQHVPQTFPVSRYFEKYLGYQ